MLLDNENAADFTDLVPSDRYGDDTRTAAFLLELKALQEHFRTNLNNIEPRPSQMGNSYDDATYPIEPEKIAWLNVLMTALQDHLGLNKLQHYGCLDPCIECHESADCDCIVAWIPCTRSRKNPNGSRRRHVDLAFADGWRDCPNSHTNQQCATRWIASDEVDQGSFRWTCDVLNLDYEYVRGKIATMDSEDWTRRGVRIQ